MINRAASAHVYRRICVCTGRWGTALCSLHDGALVPFCFVRNPPSGVGVLRGVNKAGSVNSRLSKLLRRQPPSRRHLAYHQRGLDGSSQRHPLTKELSPELREDSRLGLLGHMKAYRYPERLQPFLLDILVSNLPQPIVIFPEGYLNHPSTLEPSNMSFLKKLLLSRHGSEHLPQEVLNVRLVYGIIGTPKFS